MDQIYTEAQLVKIIDEALIHMCACPAQVANQILQLRKLYRYQLDCEQDNAEQTEVHQTIGLSTTVCHAELERCLGRVLEVVGWDLDTPAMPESLRKSRDDLMQNI
ncbi:hypothetical protein GALL_312310 [mine drainage metagenome]|uniref:Uncharacterized protein n=1 Tax=mine drainage metagenome TaxID=410659 RepID=A0A1J5RB62_9ZZZZ